MPLGHASSSTSISAPTTPAPAPTSAFGSFQINLISPSTFATPAPPPISAFTSTFAANLASSALPPHLRPTSASSRIPSAPSRLAPAPSRVSSASAPLSVFASTSTFHVNLPAPPAPAPPAPSTSSRVPSTPLAPAASTSTSTSGPSASTFMSSFAINPPPPSIASAPFSVVTFQANLDPSAAPTPIPSPPGSPPPYPIAYNYPEDPQPVSCIILSENKLY